jgi:hypothetical protein
MELLYRNKKNIPKIIIKEAQNKKKFHFFYSNRDFSLMQTPRQEINWFVVKFICVMFTPGNITFYYVIMMAFLCCCALKLRKLQVFLEIIHINTFFQVSSLGNLISELLIRINFKPRLLRACWKYKKNYFSFSFSFKIEFKYKKKVQS